MKVRHLTAEDYRRQAWKNGGGFTTELAVEGDFPSSRPSPRRGEGEFLWRLSIAEIEQSGPFSDFAGYERTIMLLSGDGMELHFDGAATKRIDRREEPFVFDGGWKTVCTLIEGPAKDMNLVVDRQRARATMRVRPLQPAAELLVGSDRTILYVLRGEATVTLLDAELVAMRGESLRFDDAGQFTLPTRATQPDTAIVEIGIART